MIRATRFPESGWRVSTSISLLRFYRDSFYCLPLLRFGKLGIERSVHMSNVIIVSADCHAGALPAAYKEYQLWTCC